MGYIGQQVKIQYGDTGLITDVAAANVPPNALIGAMNVSMENGILEKFPGSRRWNTSALSSGIVALYDYFPEDFNQKIMVLLADGTVRKFQDRTSSSVITSSSVTMTASDYGKFVEGGREVSGNSKKLFLFNGKNPVQVISGDGTSMSTISAPPSDWTGSNQPKFGIMHRGRLWCFGNDNFRHNIYASSGTNHENFTSNNLTFSVYAGDHDRLYSGLVYKGKLFLFKYPKGLYVLVDDAVDTTDWYFQKLNDDFGIAGPHAAAQVLDDVLLGNSTGSITSMAAAFQLGDIESADVLNNLRVERYLSAYTKFGKENRQALYYEDKKQVYFTYEGTGQGKNTIMLCIDMSNKQPKVTVTNKDQSTCLALIRDVNRVQRPAYGSSDGYIYNMDIADRIVGDIISTPTAPSGALAGAGAGNLTNGVYSYKVSYVSFSGGETAASTASGNITVTDKTTDGQIKLTLPVSSDGRVMARRIYRTIAGGSTYYLLNQVFGNSVTIWTDNTSDTGLSLSDTPIATANTRAYTFDVQTPHMDFGSQNNKLFEFLEIMFEETGATISCDVFIDGVKKETTSYVLTQTPILGAFTLGTHRVVDRATRSIRKKIHGRGRTISFRFYNNTEYENPKISSIIVSYRVGDEGQKKES